MKKLNALALLLALTTSAQAGDHRFTAALIADGEGAPDGRIHGIALAAWDGRDLSGTTDLAAEFNTDTLRLNATDIGVGPDTTLNFQLTGERYIAGLANDYWQDREILEERSFRSSYVMAQAWTKTRAADSLYVETELGLRRWLFSEREKTGDDFVLPPESWVLEPRLRLTWWRLEDDAAWHDRHRLFPRLRGFALGLEAGFDMRTEKGRWGDPEDDRNLSQKGIARLRPWALAGWQFAESFRWQGGAEGALATGEDDLTRRRVGGLMPYSVQIPGVPWAHHLADRYVGAQTALPINVAATESANIELGPLVALAVLPDLHRSGDTDDFGVEWGAGVFADARFGNWQVDVRGGLSPSLGERSGHTSWTVLAGGGWTTGY